jgi:hypothetical protein
MNHPTNDVLSPVRLRRDLERLSRETGWSVNFTDESLTALIYQVIELEEMLFARWPRSVLLRRRWRRDVRASIRHVQGGDFAERRGEAIGTGWMSRPGSRYAEPGSRHAEPLPWAGPAR